MNRTDGKIERPLFAQVTLLVTNNTVNWTVIDVYVPNEFTPNHIKKGMHNRRSVQET